MKVAVIGAGAAGLASAREFLERGHDVSVYEQGSKPGGVWAYTPQVEDDLLGLAPTRRVYSSLYENLRTNLPIDLMAFKGFPYKESGQDENTAQRFPHHTSVLAYLERYIAHFELASYIQLDTRVDQVKRRPNQNTWQLTTDAGVVSEFDVVVGCSGHFSKPRVPRIHNQDQFTGERLHSHNYRRARDFSQKTVAVFGRGASGADIVQELRSEAKHIYWCGFEEPASFANVDCIEFPQAITKSGFISQNQEFVTDVLLYCTGYEYELPFLDNELVSIDDNFVSPLYKDIIPPAYPSLGLIGLPFLVVPFPLYAMQAKWFAASIDGAFDLPSEAEMYRVCEQHQHTLNASGVMQRHFHRLGERQEDYYHDLATQCGAPGLPLWFGELALEAQRARMENPANFRDMPLSIPKQVHN